MALHRQKRILCHKNHNARYLKRVKTPPLHEISLSHSHAITVRLREYSQLNDGARAKPRYGRSSEAHDYSGRIAVASPTTNFQPHLVGGIALSSFGCCRV